MSARKLNNWTELRLHNLSCSDVTIFGFVSNMKKSNLCFQNMIYENVYKCKNIDNVFFSRTQSEIPKKTYSLL